MKLTKTMMLFLAIANGASSFAADPKFSGKCQFSDDESVVDTKPFSLPLSEDRKAYLRLVRHSPDGPQFDSFIVAVVVEYKRAAGEEYLALGYGRQVSSPSFQPQIKTAPVILGKTLILRDYIAGEDGYLECSGKVE